MSEADASITGRVPLAIRRAGRKTVVTPVWDGGATAIPTRADPALVKALARGHRWKRILEKGRYASISEMAKVEKVERGYLGTLLQLTLLAPDIVEAILDGRQPDRMGLPTLMEPLSLEWNRQRAALSGPEPAVPDRHSDPGPITPSAVRRRVAGGRDACVAGKGG
jgi:hypothetical protein